MSPIVFVNEMPCMAPSLMACGKVPRTKHQKSHKWVLFETSQPATWCRVSIDISKPICRNATFRDLQRPLPVDVVDEAGEDFDRVNDAHDQRAA